MKILSYIFAAMLALLFLVAQIEAADKPTTAPTTGTTASKKPSTDKGTTASKKPSTDKTATATTKKAGSTPSPKAATKSPTTPKPK